MSEACRVSATTVQVLCSSDWATRRPMLCSSICAQLAQFRPQVNDLWAGLGYYRRAKYLHSGAQHVVSELGGRFPTISRELQKIPGVATTAKAHECRNLVDGQRVVSQLNGRFLTTIRELQESPDAVHISGNAISPVQTKTSPGDHDPLPPQSHHSRLGLTLHQPLLLASADVSCISKRQGLARTRARRSHPSRAASAQRWSMPTWCECWRGC